MYQLAFLHWCECVSNERMPLSICYWCLKFRHTVHLIACMFLFSFIFWFEPVLLLVLASYCHYQDFNTIQIRLHVHALLSLIKLYEHCSSNLTFKNVYEDNTYELLKGSNMWCHMYRYFIYLSFYWQGNVFVKAWMTGTEYFKSVYFVFDVMLLFWVLIILWNFVTSYLS